ncbi:MAG: hypothetical protein IPL35_13040 [Sphingobacteriales bacterium]|nr:hypothetical protein [Sphingobacteriales bacterium]
MKHFLLLSLVLFLQCTNNHKNEFDYYSIEKSQLNHTYGRVGGSFNFYKFQQYYQSIQVDSVYLDEYQQNFEDSAIYRLLLNNYLERGYNTKIELLSRIGQINADSFNDTSIIVLDINDSISLINLSPEFTIYALGTCCSPYQNLLIKKSGDSIVVFDELHQGKLLGVYISETAKINGLLFQGQSNDIGNFESLNGTYNYKYKVNTEGIIFDKITNVRNGEPFDKNDKDISDKDFEIKSVYFENTNERNK